MYPGRIDKLLFAGHFLKRVHALLIGVLNKNLFVCISFSSYTKQDKIKTFVKKKFCCLEPTPSTLDKRRVRGEKTENGRRKVKEQ